MIRNNTKTELTPLKSNFLILPKKRLQSCGFCKINTHLN